MIHDLKSAWSSVARGGVSSVAIVLTLALGIGAVGVMFSMLHGILLRPLDYHRPHELVVVAETYDGALQGVSPPALEEWSREAGTLADVAGYVVRNVSLTGAGEPERMIAGFVSPSFFAVLGRDAALGRTFTEADAAADAASVVLSHGVWQRRFGGDPAVLGRTVSIEGEPWTVVGVMGEDYVPVLDAELWMPLGLAAGDLAPEQRAERYLGVLARLAPGVGAGEASEQVGAMAARAAQLHPATNEGWSATVVGLHELAVGDYEAVLYLLLGAAALVLLLVCANVVNLLTARYLERQGELALRTALGADRGRLLRQLLVEASLLAVAGGVLAIGLTWAGVRLIRLHGPQDIPRLEEVGVNVPVLAFVLLLALACGLLVGLLPALQVSRIEPQRALRELGTRATAGRGRAALRNLLVTSQVALALALLVGAALLVGSLRNLLDVDPGFEPENVLVMRVVQSSDTGMDRSRTFAEQVVDRLRAVPGITTAGVATNVPLAESSLTMAVTVADRAAAGAPPEVNYEVVSPGYFEALGIERLEGRLFTDADRRGAPRVAMVNQALARRLWPEGGAVGGRVSFDGAEGPWWTVVGVVGDVRRFDLAEEAPMQVLVPWSQDPWYFMTFVARTQGRPEAVMAAARRAVRETDDDQAIATIGSMEDLLAETLGRRRFNALLVTIFGLSALLLTAVGLYGVMAYLVARRHHEIAVRLALGADRPAILRLVMGRGVTLLAAGVAAGLIVALLLSRFLERLLYEISPTDGSVFVVVTALVAAVALVASFIPSYRSTRIDPVQALRQ